jgi:integrase
MTGNMNEIRPGVWRLRVYAGKDPVTGQKRHASKTFKGTQRQAETALSRFVTEVVEGQHAGSGSVTLAALLERYIAHCIDRDRSPTTVDSYRRHAANIRDGLGAVQLAKLRPEDFDQLYSVLRTRGVPGGRGGLSAASVKRHAAFISAALSQAVKWGWIASNPALKATAPTVHQAKVNVPSPAELQSIMERAQQSTRPDHALLLAIAAMTGARRGELCALRFSDVDLANGVIHFHRSLKQVGRTLTTGDTKTHQERSTALPASAVTMLRKYRRQLREQSERLEIPLAADPYVFSPVVDHGRPFSPSSLTQMFTRIAKQLEMPYTLHGLRHFAATQAIAGGHDVVTVASRLGHADPSVTLRVYAAPLADRDRALAESLGELVAAPGG